MLHCWCFFLSTVADHIGHTPPLCSPMGFSACLNAPAPECVFPSLGDAFQVPRSQFCMCHPSMHLSPTSQIPLSGLVKIQPAIFTWYDDRQIERNVIAVIIIIQGSLSWSRMCTKFPKKQVLTKISQKTSSDHLGVSFLPVPFLPSLLFPSFTCTSLSFLPSFSFPLPSLSCFLNTYFVGTPSLSMTICCHHFSLDERWSQLPTLLPTKFINYSTKVSSNHSGQTAEQAVSSGWENPSPTPAPATAHLQFSWEKVSGVTCLISFHEL